MNRIVLLLCTCVGSSIHAGGTIGGSTGCRMSLELAETAFDIENLPKSYVDQNEFDQVNQLLSTKGVSRTTMTVNGKLIQVRKIRDRLVDVKISNQILPQ